ncbi:LOW QUALITY PROTEIN: protein NLP2-like [Prunus avium]|uniref:LOW QUALITY PROTEIN: protein NLP2-like n=2 Tax=Prunus TaxID=3754 RepID=A0A6P5SD72_PRUAV|nr:LOW QUALITY PROTEIN: protein NLP2-like [Prunus avium]
MSPHQQIYQEENTDGSYPESHSSFAVEGNTEADRRLWIGPRVNPGPSSSMKERLMLAIGYLKECTKGRDVLIQIWVPIKRGGRQYLTTRDQPFSLDPNCKSLAGYRNVSKDYQFITEEDSAESVGLPGRAFLGKLPEWTPDVRFFRSYEYPRIDYAQQYDVRGSLALPIFENGSGTCLGVVEIVMTPQKVNYRPELEYVCQALEAVDLRSSQNFCPHCVKTCDELYQAALTEIVEVLASVCKTHRLPLAQTWAPCIQQGKGGCRHSDENYAHCVSTVDAACFVADLDILGLHEACSEHHLCRGQGIVGAAFTTNKPCFATDIKAFSKTEYPLSHHARMFGLHAAVAIPFRSVCTGPADFVLEFFLPKDCQDPEEQKQMLNSLCIVIQQACWSLHVDVDKELEEEIMFPIREPVIGSDGGLHEEETQRLISSPTEEPSGKESSWIAHMIEAQQKGKGVSVSLDYQTEEPKEEFKVTTHWDNTQGSLHSGQVFSEFGQLHQSSGSHGNVEGGADSYSFGGRRTSGGRKAGEKRRTKTEKTISLPVLRQYFAGSLKDAAKSIGVCPTTLKRICRQNGITRWPSRKIKMVGHSLKKLQLVIDSVQGAEGAIHIGSFYSSFPELNSPKFPGSGQYSSMNMSDHSKQVNPLQHDQSGLYSHGTTTKSPSSSCSQTSGPSVCVAGAQQHTVTINTLSSGDALMTEDPVGVLKRACSDADLHASFQEETKLIYRSESHKSFSDNLSYENLPPLPGSSGRSLRDGLQSKSYFGMKKIRFSMLPNCSFRDLQLEIARRFNLDDISRTEIKYLDDDREWVLLNCDADLEECMEIYSSSPGRTVRLCLQQVFHPNLAASFGNSSPS